MSFVVVDGFITDVADVTDGFVTDHVVDDHDVTVVVTDLY